MKNDPTAQEIGKRIREYRKKQNLTQLALAQKADIDPNTLARLERGQHRASPLTIEKLSGALKLTNKEVASLIK